MSDRNILDATTYQRNPFTFTNPIEVLQKKMTLLEERVAYLENLLREKTDEKP